MSKSMNPELALLPINSFGDVRLQIVEGVKGLIQAGRLQAGESLPPTAALAEHWNVRVHTVQEAMQALSKAGMLDRKQGRGTVVRRRRERLQRIGMFIGRNAALSGSYSPMVQAVCSELCIQLDAQDIQSSLWVDPRGRGEPQASPWDKLMLACERRECQVLIAMGLAGEHLDWMPQLPVPVVHYSDHWELPSRVSSDPITLAQAGVEALMRQGCRRPALISAVHERPFEYQGRRNPFAEFSRKFRSTADALGLECHPEWLSTPDHLLPPDEYEPFGYAAMQALWQRTSRPDGLFAFTDFTARGVLLALEGLHVDVPTDLKLALFRNDGGHRYYNRFPTTYVENDATASAAALIGLAHELYDGQAGRVEVVPWRQVHESRNAELRLPGGNPTIENPTSCQVAGVIDAFIP